MILYPAQTKHSKLYIIISIPLSSSYSFNGLWNLNRCNLVSSNIMSFIKVFNNLSLHFDNKLLLPFPLFHSNEMKHRDETTRWNNEIKQRDETTRWNNEIKQRDETTKWNNKMKQRDETTRWNNKMKQRDEVYFKKNELYNLQFGVVDW